MMGLIDQVVFSLAIFLVVLGLIFEASGFAIVVVGRLDGLLLVVMGTSMFWGGWVLSGARGASCALAAVLNMFDASSTLSFWSFEINPLVRLAGPTMFMTAKVVCSITIVLFAKLHPSPKKGGILLTLFFSLIVGWNLGQHALAYLGLRIMPYHVYIYFLGAMLSFIVSAITLSLLLLRREFVT